MAGSLLAYILTIPIARICFVNCDENDNGISNILGAHPDIIELRNNT